MLRLGNMKGLLSVLFFVLFFLLFGAVNEIHAATLYWVGDDGANASGDTINFDADCDNGASWDNDIDNTSPPACGILPKPSAPGKART